jgi:hypothetical protein
VTADWHPTFDQIADDDAGLTSADDSRAIAAHLADCSACRETAERLAEVTTLLSEAGMTVDPMPVEVADALDRALATASAERAAGVPSLDERRAVRDEHADATSDSPSSGSGGRRGRWVFGTAAAVAVFAIGAAVANNGPPGSTNNDDSAASRTSEDAGAGAAASGDRPEAARSGAGQDHNGDANFLARTPQLDADNVDTYAEKLADGETTPTKVRRTTCGNLAPEPQDAAVTSTLSSIVSYDGKRALLRVDRDARRLTVLSCPGPTRVLYTSGY